MPDILQKTVYAFIPIFVAMDVIAVLPIYISMTEGLSNQTMRSIERDSVITALAVGLSFLAVGEFVFRILGITANDFKIAGGLVLLVFAIIDLMGYTRTRQQTGTDKWGVVPIGVPLVVGPAVLTTILVSVDHYGTAPTIISFIANLFIVWVSFRSASQIVRLLGRSGIVAISKIMALLLASIAVMMIRLGIENLVRPQ